MSNENLPDTVVEAIRSGHKIEAIKLLREARGIGLKEAKRLVDRAAAAERPESARQPLRPESTPWLKIVAVAVIVGLLVWYLGR